MIKYVIVLLFVSGIHFFSFSQNTTNKQSKIAIQIDSLNNIAEKLFISNPDSVLSISKIVRKLSNGTSYVSGFGTAIMYESYAFFYKKEYDNARSSISESISFLSNTNDSYNLGFAYNELARLDELLGDTENAEKYFSKSIELMSKVSDVPNLRLVYNNFGAFYQRQGNYIESIRNYIKALEIAEKYNNERASAAYLSNIGNVYFYQGNYEKTLEYYYKAEEIQKRIKDIKSLGITNNNIGSVYIMSEKYEEAIPILHKAYAYRKELEDIRGAGITATSLSIVFKQLKEYDSANFYNQQALAFQEQTQNQYDLSLILTNLTEIHLLQKKYDKALEYANRGYKVSKGINSISRMSDILQLKKNILYEKGDYKTAFDIQALYNQIKDSLYNIEKTSEINAILLERKELENERLEQDNAFKIIALEKEKFQRKTKEQEFNLLEKQAEADRLLALAKDAKNKQKADSLYQAAQNAQLEADNLKIKAEKIEADKRATKAESDQKIAFQRNISIIFGIGILAALAIAYIAYRNQRNKQRANFLLAEKNEEINLQNELLANSNHTKDRLFSIIAHDLRSPIAAFQSTSRQINFFLQKNKPERIKDIGNQIETSSQNLSAMLNNLLHWALLQQNNHIKINKTQLSITQSVEHVFKGYQIIATANHIILENRISENIFGFVDKDSFQTILRNIIGNALKYTPEEGKISVSATQQENSTLLKISDTGVGMSEEVKEKLFQLNVSNTSRGIRGEKGTGLGLVLCYEFAKLNDIKIDIESKEELGTTFLLTIPNS